MSVLRRLLFARPLLALLLIAAALLARAVLPSGYMLDSSSGSVVVTLCSGSGPVTMTMPMPEGHGPDHGDHKAESPCAFSGLASAAIGGAGPILLAALIVWVLAIVMRRAALAPVAAPRQLRPPLRGPPAIA